MRSDVARKRPHVLPLLTSQRELCKSKANAKLLAEENQIIVADLSLTKPEQRASFEKKQAIIRQLYCDRTYIA
jgi:predicted rRNA methylase YqxC with S4 and FtsJ domains